MNVTQTPRLNLRLLALQDVESMHGLIYADPEVAIPLLGHVLSLEELRAPRALLSRIASASHHRTPPTPSVRCPVAGRRS